MRKQIEEYMRLLVGTDTSNPPGKEKYLAEKLIALAKGFPYERIEHDSCRESLIITVEGEDTSRILGFAGHLDTVPVGQRELWIRNPFGEIVGEVMYGRGAADMCGGLAAMLLLLESCRHKRPPVTLKLIFTADEEEGGTGAAAIADRGYLKGIMGLILCEPSGLSLGISEKGALWLKILVKGINSHASMPMEGRNALEAGMNFLLELKTAIEALSRPHPLLGGNTCEITGCRSGVKMNILPGLAEFDVDIRTLPGLNNGNAAVLQILSELKGKYEKSHGVSIMAEPVLNRQPIEEPEDSPFVSHIKKAVQPIHSISTTGIYFFTDGSVLIPGEKLPFVILGPGDPAQCHKIDEHIDLNQIGQCYRMYRNIVDRFQV